MYSILHEGRQKLLVNNFFFSDEKSTLYYTYMYNVYRHMYRHLALYILKIKMSFLLHIL